MTIERITSIFEQPSIAGEVAPPPAAPLPAAPPMPADFVAPAWPQEDQAHAGASALEASAAADD